MNKAEKSIPELKSEGEERAFWEIHDSTEYVDWSRAKVATFPNLSEDVERD